MTKRGESKQAAGAQEVQPPQPLACEQRASFISRVTIGWLDGLLLTGYRRPLSPDDMPEIREDALTAPVCEKFLAAWAEERKRPKPSLYRVIWRVHKHTLVWTGLAQLLYFGAAVANPMIMREVLMFLMLPNGERWRGYMLALALFLLPLCGSLLNQHSLLANARVGMVLRSALSAGIYRKALVLDNGARQSSTAGQIVNLMATDCQRFAEVSFMIHLTWVAPIVVAAVMALLLAVIGWQALVGVGVMLLLFPVNGFIAARTQSLRTRQTKLSDERIRTTNEILQGIRVIKFYAWEGFFREKMDALRAAECRLLLSQANLRALMMFFLVGTPALVSLATFVTFALTSGEMTPDRVFTCLSLFAVLRFPLSFLPMVIAIVVQTRVAIRRLGDFLLLPEMEIPDRSLAPGEAPSARIHGGEFAWDAPPPGTEKEKEKEGAGPAGGSPQKRSRRGRREAQAPRAGGGAEKGGPGQQANGHPAEEAKGEGKEAGAGVPAGPTLRGIDFEAGAGQLVAVVGPVGSGKSSLLSALLGDIRRRAGSVRVAGRVAYVAQQAWIVNATLKENVLFGERLDERRYRETIAACALDRDIAVLPAGHETEIGEKGINLSGGQKQRVSLARAVYADADVYLFDDPLSAVDPHVGRHLFEKCICGALRGKTRVLVTNQLHYLAAADAIYVLKEGRLAEAGTYHQLMLAQGPFAELMAAYGHGEEEGEGAEAGEEAGAGGRGRAPSATAQGAPTGIDCVTIEVDGEGAPGPAPGPGREAAGGSRKAEGGSKRPASAAPKEARDGTLVHAEERATGHVAWAVYRAYFDAAGGMLVSTVVLLLYLLAQAMQAGNDVWLSVWTGRQIQPDPGHNFYVGIYGAFGGAFAVAGLLRAFAFARVSVVASKALYHGMLARVLRAPMSFFDTTPIGRILNRFSKDTDQIDQFLAVSADQAIVTALGLVAVVGVISGYLPWMLLAFVPLGALYYYIQRFYRRTSTELQRLESVSKSPVYTHFSETLSGVSTIRAYGAQPQVVERNDVRTDVNNRSYYILQVANRWLGLRLDLLGATALFLVSLLCVSGRETGINPGTAGLVISYSMNVTQVLSWCVRMSTELEAKMNSVERVVEYSEIPSEAPAVVEGSRPPEGWPHHGRIQVERLVMRYREGLEPVLRGVSLDVRPGEKVGVVGRTGAGKSSLMLALFRLVEAAEGRVAIDATDIAAIGLADLRSRLAIIPQDPVLFSGTVRENLDPTGRAPEAELWEALELCQLRPLVESLPGRLDAKVAEAGENLSVGQRQLVCVARAVLRRPKVLVLDEATANIDVETDAVIQRTIRRQFASCTVLTIAHRLNTVMDADRILVLDRGQVAEFDSPAALLARPGSLLSGMVDQTGAAAARHLRRIANRESSVFDAHGHAYSAPSSPMSPAALETATRRTLSAAASVALKLAAVAEAPEAEAAASARPSGEGSASGGLEGGAAVAVFSMESSGEAGSEEGSAASHGSGAPEAPDHEHDHEDPR
eukprot:tig00020554_g10943.t1